MIQRLLRLIGVIVAGLLLQGCPPPGVVRLSNNTGDDLVIYPQDGEVPWPNAATITIQDWGDELSWRRMDGREMPDGFFYSILTVGRESDILQYALRLPGWPMSGEPRWEPVYINPKTAARVTSYQLESDGSLYVVRSDLPLPATTLPPQPPGFPLRPEIVERRRSP